jgi:uncharacterized protein with HEPN domain
MAPPDDATRLRHILDSARKTIQFACGKGLDDLVADEKLLLALTRLLEIIGEAAAGVSDEFRKRHPEVPWRQMSDTRNRLIHAYFDTDPRLVWETVEGELPSLIQQVEAIVKREM